MKNIYLIRRVFFFTVFFATVCLVSAPALANDPSVQYVTLERVNFRVAPSLDAEILATVNPGTNVTVESSENGWYRVFLQETYGYMNAEFIGSPEELRSGGFVELLSWAEARNVFTVGVPAEIQDVRTGRKYYVKSFSNGNHADVEPVTQSDTDTMQSTYNGRWSWDTRPILVTINGRTMAASINGMPHGGGVNSGNGMDGQVCIHFQGSTTHNGNRSHEWDHQNSVMEAYNGSR